jgi:hypothetical protein
LLACLLKRMRLILPHSFFSSFSWFLSGEERFFSLATSLFISFAMPLYQVAIPAIVLAHVIGFALLLYSLEKVSGIVSRTTRKLSWKKKGATPNASSAEAEAGRVNHSVRSLQPSPSKSIHNTVKTKGWVRGCACTVSSKMFLFFLFFFFERERSFKQATSHAGAPVDSWGWPSSPGPNSLAFARVLEPLSMRGRATSRGRPFKGSSGANGGLNDHRARQRRLEQTHKKQESRNRLALSILRVQ